ncbi:GlxA family transcriptional regulator [Plantactinospora sp. WMMC1484]|uniref:GlxA family transcriptional regulator n=1 Tax=Plantactinospora sp. WMMC1484 TaxID=3404122 RepID=UPI003BF57EE8
MSLPAEGPRTIVVVGYPGAELLDIACLTSTFDYANRAGRHYRILVVSPGGQPMPCQSGLVLNAQAPIERLRGPIDTIIVAGGEGAVDAAEDDRLVAHVRRLARETRRIASVCTGAWILAATGLLDGRRATTHWMFADLFAARYPAVEVDPAPIYLREGDVSTAAGVTSALDLALAFVEEDLGGEVARHVARGLVTYLQRPGNQAQMSMFLAAPAPDDDLVRDLVALIRGTPDADLGLAALAARASVSERHLTRLFVAHLGQTPARYVRTVRLEAAAQLLVSSRLPLARVAARCGFTSAEALRQAFVDRYGVTPSRYRASFATGPDRRRSPSRAGERRAGRRRSSERREDQEAEAERHVQQHAGLRQ